MRKYVLTLLALLGFAGVVSAQQFTTVTSTIVDSAGTPYVLGTYSISLVNTTGQQATLGGNANFQKNFNGALTAAGLFSVNLPSVTQLFPLGMQWTFNICANPQVVAFQFPALSVPCFSYTSTGTQVSGSSVDLSSSMTAVAAVIPKTPTTTSNIAFTGNNTHSGTETFTGGLSADSINTMLVVGPIPFRYTTIAAAHTALPASGGTVFVRNDATLDTSTFTPTKPIALYFDIGTYTYTGTGPFIQNTTGVEGVRIQGQQRGGSGTTQGTIIKCTNTASTCISMTNSPGIHVDSFTLVGPGSGTGKGLSIGGTRWSMFNIEVSSWGSDGIFIDGGTVNSNKGTCLHVRSQNNGGNGFTITGANANNNGFHGCDAGGNSGWGFQILSSAQMNGFWNADTAGNTLGGYDLGGAGGNELHVFSDSPISGGGTENIAIQVETNSNNNLIYCLKAVMPINTDNGGGTRNYSCGGTFGAGGSVWSRLNSQAFVSSDGTVGGPAFVFSNESNSGFYRAGASDERFAQVGADYWRWLGTGAILSSGLPLAWGSSGVGSPDVGLSRSAVGVVAVGNSSAGNVTGKLRAAEVMADGGTVCTNGELALSAGWQSTGSATVTAVAGTGQTCSWTITTGTTTAANPTVTDTLTNTLTAATTRCWMFLEYGPASTHTAAAGEGFAQTTLSATAPIFTFNGTPTAAGKTYLVVRTCGP